MLRSKITENLPILISILFFIVISGFTVNGLYVDTGELEKNNKTILSDFIFEFQERIEYEFNFVEKFMVNNWIDTSNLSDLFSYSRYQEIVPSYYNVSNNILAINWINSSGVINWVYPYDRNKGAINQSIVYFVNGEFNDAFDYSLVTNKTGFTHLIPFFQGGTGFASYIPIIYNNTVTGYFNVVFEITNLLQNVFQNSESFKQYSFVLVENNISIWVSDEHYLLSDSFVAKQTSTLFNFNWEIYSRPSPELIWNVSPFSVIPVFAFAFLFCIVIYILTDLLKKKNEIIEKEFNEKEKIMENLFRDKQLKALGTLAGGIAHDFNNLITNMTGHLNLIELQMNEVKENELNSESRKQISKSLEAISKNLNRSRDISNQILAFSRQSNVKFEVIDLLTVIYESVSLIKETADKRIEFVTDIETGLFVYGNHTKLIQVFMNLLINSINAVNLNDALIEIKAERSKNPYNVELIKKINLQNPKINYSVRGCIVKIRDNGKGMTEEQMENAFDPFYTNSISGKGTGLGLGIAHANISSLGGIIVLKSKLGEFTEVEIQLPLIQQSPYSSEIHSESGTEVTPEFTKESKLVFLIDDEEDIIKSYGRILDKKGFKTISSKDSIQAWNIFRTYSKEIDLVLLDINMPGLNGIELVKLIKELNPNQKIIIMTGFSDKVIDIDETIPIIQKPFEISDLLNIIIQTINE